MPKNRGNCVFSAKLQDTYKFIKKTAMKSVVDCSKCSSRFSIAAGGKTDIERHLKTSKHVGALNAASSSKSLSAYFSSMTDEGMPACEATWTYHLIKQSHSFRSSDCSSKIFRTCFKMLKFSCGRTKCEAIVTDVLAPHVETMIANELEKCSFVCISTDASNHGSTKIFPVAVRYFLPTVGIRVRLLEFSAEKGETSEIITALLMKTAEKNNILKKIVAFAGDNAKTNFGGETRGGQNNVFARLKKEFPHLIGVGCAAHIVHNTLKYACDAMPFDVESTVVKIYSHFYIYAVRTEALKSFVEVAGEQYMKLLGYAKTRFLALGPAIGRILKLFDGLKAYFESLPGASEAMLKTFFLDPKAKFWLLFIKDQVINTKT